MKAAIAEARNSRGEDDRLHPLVGAVLTDKTGKILFTAHRGMDGAGGHAEYNLLKELDKNAGLNRSELSLFVTLEPCSRRSERKTPCAVRVAKSGIGTVYVGTLDPNPQIIGRGVNHLISAGLVVEHFPADLRAEILDLNASFQGSHSFLVDPVVVRDDEDSPRQRAGILASTLDLIAGADTEVMIHAGDASWLPKIFVALVEARLRNVPIRLIANAESNEKVLDWVSKIGVDVVVSNTDTGLRATLSSNANGPKDLIVIEQRPSRHALTFSGPHEGSILDLVAREFEIVWKKGVLRSGGARRPVLRPIDHAELFEALRDGVREYREAAFSIVDLPPSKMARLTAEIEIFKLRRVASTLRILKSICTREPLSIGETPWGLFPPIVEQDAEGNLTLIDGIHRHYLTGHESSIPVVLVKNVRAPLPAAPTLDAPRIVAGRSDRPERYINYSGQTFRDIKKALQTGPWTTS